MFNFSFLLTGDTDSSGNIISTVIMIAVLVLVFWLFMLRPQKKQEKKEREMRDSLAVGDEITTIGGIIGKIVSIKGDTFVLETTKDKTKIRFLRGAIRSVDVKAADIAAAVITENQEPENSENTELKNEESENSKSQKGIFKRFGSKKVKSDGNGSEEAPTVKD